MRKSKQSEQRARRALRIVGATVLVVFGLASCVGDQTAVTQEEAEQAFMVSYAAMFVGSMTAALQQERVGISVDTGERTITLSEFDVTDLQTPYESVSGTITGQEGSSLVEFDLIGGPATSVVFEIAADQMIVGDRIQQSIEVNGRSFDIDLDRTALEL